MTKQFNDEQPPEQWYGVRQTIRRELNAEWLRLIIRGGILWRE